MVTIKIAAFVGLLLLAGLLVQRVMYPPTDTITAASSEQVHHKPVIDLDKLGRAFRA
jgi:hypothetical protein